MCGLDWSDALGGLPAPLVGLCAGIMLSTQDASEVAAGFLVFLYLILSFPQLHIHMVIYNVLYSAALGDIYCSRGSQIPSVSLSQNHLHMDIEFVSLPRNLKHY